MTNFKKTASCFDCNHKLNLFCYLSQEQLEKVDHDRQEVHFKKGETIFKTGGPLTHMICVTRGLVKIFLEDEITNKRILIKIVKPVELMLGPGFLVDNRHHFTAVALEDTTACYIEIERHKEVMLNNPEYSTAIVKHVNETVIKQFDKMLSLTHKHTHGKVAESLLYLSKQVYKSNDFETTLSRQDLAELGAMTKETVIRILKEFVEDGIIECNHNHFKILDVEKLTSISRKG